MADPTGGAPGVVRGSYDADMEARHREWAEAAAEAGPAGRKTLRTTESGRLVLESGSPLGSSMLWSLQRDFYEDKGVDAWSKGIVPNYVTTKCVAGALSPAMQAATAQLPRRRHRAAAPAPAASSP